MDPEIFENPDEISVFVSDKYSSVLSAKEALELIDQAWYMLANKRARWMDLLGDYAGTEPFVIDGESLLQMVLDDPLLALGRDGDPSFQILHALYILERTLMEFNHKDGQFEIIFWKINRHATVQTGGPPSIVASRTLARCLLIRHLVQSDISVHVFEDLEDPSWLQYEATKKPMFIMANGGGLLDETASRLTAERILCQRMFFFSLLSRGISVTLFKGTEYRDSKIFSFVYEQHRVINPKSIFPNKFWTAVVHAKDVLDECDRESGIDTSSLSSAHLRSPSERDPLIDISRRFLQKLSNSKSLPMELLYIFMLHCILLNQIPVRQRARQLEELNPNLLRILLNDFLPTMMLATAGSLSTLSSTVPFDIDGRVFCSLVRFMIVHHTVAVSTLVGERAFTILTQLWSEIGSPLVNLSHFAARFPHHPLRLASPDASPHFRLLPFDNDVFNAELTSVHVPVSGSDDPPTFTELKFGGRGTLFSDTQHWHNQKAILPSYLGGSDPKPSDERARRRLLRSNQRFMATMQTQAATLSGTSGGTLKPIVIPPVGMSTPRNRPQVRISKPTKKEKASKLSSADKLRQKIKEKKTASQDDMSQQWWQEQLEAMSTLTTVQKIWQMNALFRNKKSEELAMGAEMRLYRLQLEISVWLEDANSGSASVRDKHTVAIMRMIKDICSRGYMTQTISKALKLVLSTLGFADYLAGLLDNCDIMPDKPLNFKFKKFTSSSKGSSYEVLRITEHPIVWQLRLFGEYMDRSMDSAPDPRVQFKPDAWQREVLDCIDTNHSLLVVAPTSAGKTFISYYAMEKVLRDSDDGILVYVAPTKALVTQIAAEVYARFRKSLNGASCWAIHTRDYRVHDPQKCQILVTVPEILATMLLSPPLARVWTSRIKRIILDEIHSIGQQEGGAVWEQIILLAPCPIIGLSATIGSPEKFNTWLETVQTAHGHKHKFIQHPHRYSHLRKFFYDLSQMPSSPFTGLASYQETGRKRFLHPISLLSFGARSLPEDLALEAGDTLKLYQALEPYEAISNCDISALEPTSFFAARKTLLRQKDILEYEAKLKGVVSQFIAVFDAQNPHSALHSVINNLEDPGIAVIPLEMRAMKLNTLPSQNIFKSNLIYLLGDLHSRGELPVILFNFDRAACESMAQTLLATLQDAESHWRATNRNWQQKLRRWDNWKSRSKERERLAEMQKKLKKRPEAEYEDRSETMDHSWESSFNPDDPSPDFSFAGTHTTYSKVDLDIDIRELSKWTTAQPWAIDALARGIAVHHAGMNKRYRSLIESLFREGFIRVVIATGTLALGINAPAKTSVFCGDSPYLTALMYRQCAGRAGRRGYDLLGNVIFYGLPLDRVQRLVLSKLPSLAGNFPLTSTLTLRLLNLLEGSNYAPVAVKAVKSLLSLPHISFASDAGRHQLLHHLRFSIEYLRRSRLLDKHGNPMNLFAVAAHLYYTEPSNFALVTLFQRGILYHICQQPGAAAQQNFIILMAHLFGRRYIPKAYANKKNIEELTKKYPSMVVLPELSNTINNVLTQHDQDILQIFTGYAVSYAVEYSQTLGPDTSLPLGGRDYSCAQELQAQTGPMPTFHTYLKETATSVIARSPFVANSGHSDKFSSVLELARTARSGLHLNENAIPSLGHLIAGGKRGSELEHALNAYLLDFYTHGQVQSLAAANGIRRGDVWYLLQDFTLTLITVKTALEQLLIKASKEATSTDPSSVESDDIDSGYGTFDPAETERDDPVDEIDIEETTSGFQRPVAVTDNDWRVYQVVNAAASEFETKFRAMWG